MLAGITVGLRNVDAIMVQPPFSRSVKHRLVSSLSDNPGVRPQVSATHEQSSQALPVCCTLNSGGMVCALKWERYHHPTSIRSTARDTFFLPPDFDAQVSHVQLFH
jgi:hypothetical protein